MQTDDIGDAYGGTDHAGGRGSKAVAVSPYEIRFLFTQSFQYRPQCSPQQDRTHPEGAQGKAKPPHIDRYEGPFRRRRQCRQSRGRWFISQQTDDGYMIGDTCRIEISRQDFALCIPVRYTVIEQDR